MSETYHDPWQDYKAILESLKKKFLKKPNYAQALVEFSNLALRFEDEECEHYAAMCNYQMSKIYEGLGDWSLQYSRLLKAARLFRDAEIKTHDMCSLVINGVFLKFDDVWKETFVRLLFRMVVLRKYPGKEQCPGLRGEYLLVE
uniref:Alpha-SNAP n=1 Tax=Ascaris lumbricoides TaxID=6252 RepID=A0A0M3HI18_ASCLU